jgi:Fe-S cluster biogenesis protein NfuA
MSETIAWTEKVKELIKTDIAPALQQDGGAIELVAIDEETGVISVRLVGACRGCPHASITLKNGVERYLKENVEQVTEVVSVE